MTEGMEKALKDKRLLKVICPTCFMPPGKRCKWILEKYKELSHPERLNLFFKIQVDKAIERKRS